MFGLSKRMLIVIGLLVVVALLLIVQNNKKSGAQSGGTNTTGACQMQVTADVLNIRSGPDNSANVVGKLSTGAVTAGTSTVQNGYRELSTGHWASNQFLKTVSGSC